MEDDLSYKARGFLIGLASLTMLGWVCWQVGYAGVTRGLPALLVVLVGVPLAGLAAFVPHVLGHFVAARLVGLRIRQGRLLPTIRLLYPLPSDARRLPLRMSVVILGGPLASLLAMGLCLAGAYWYDLALLTPADDLTAVFALLVAFNLYALVWNLVPYTEKDIRTDADWLLAWWRRPAGTARDVAVAVLAGRLHNGARPREWQADWTALLTGGVPDDSVGEALASLYAYYHALDRGEPARAGDWLDDALAQRDHYPPSVWPSVLAEAAYFEGFHRRDARKARLFLERLRERRIEPQTLGRAEAAALFAEGRLPEAIDRAAAALAAVDHSLEPALARAEKDWLEEIQTRCRQSPSDALTTALPRKPAPAWLEAVTSEPRPAHQEEEAGEQEGPARFTAQAALLAFGLAAVAYVVWQVVVTARQDGWLGALLVGAAPVGALLLAEMIGSLAFLAAARLLRLRVTEVGVLFFRLVVEKGRLRLRRANSGFQMHSGLPVVPLGPERVLLRVAGVALAVPLSLVLAALGCLYLSCRLAGSPADCSAVWLTPPDTLTALCNVVAAVNLSLVICAAFPSRERNRRTPAVWVLDCLQRPALVLNDLALQALLHGLESDVRPAEWPPGLVALLQARPDGSPQAVLADLCRYYYALDREEVDLAGRFLDRALAGYARSTSLRPTLAAEAAYFEGFHRRNAVAARSWLAQVPADQVSPPMQARAEAAVLFAEGRLGEALNRANSGLAQAAEQGAAGWTGAETRWLEAIQQRCREGRAGIRTR